MKEYIEIHNAFFRETTYMTTSKITNYTNYKTKPAAFLAIRAT